MARDAVAEIDAPRQRRRQAVGAILETAQETPEAADRRSDADRHDEEVAGRAPLAGVPLRDLDGDRSAEQSADDRLAADEPRRVRLEPFDRESRILERRTAPCCRSRRRSPPPQYGPACGV